jgi:hypothetical protein
LLEAVCFRDGATRNNKIDFCALAEALVFYGRVHFISNHVGFSSLLKVIGPSETLELIDRKLLHIHVYWADPAVRTLDRNTARERHDFISTSLHAKSKDSPKIDPREYCRDTYIEVAGASAKADANKFVAQLHFPKALRLNLRSIQESALEPTFGDTLVAWLRRMAPNSMPSNAKIETWPLAGQIQFGTNFDLTAVTAEIRAQGYEFEGTPASLLGHYLEIFEDSYYASELSAEITCSELRAPLMQSRFEHLWQKAQNSESTVLSFDEKTLGAARAVGAAITSGAATWSDLLFVLDKREKFRQWIADKPFDADLVTEYIDAISKDSWLDKLPNKSARWLIVTALGIGADAVAPEFHGLVASQAISVVDTFILEQLLRGWRPNQFVDLQLKPLIAK